MRKFIDLPTKSGITTLAINDIIGWNPFGEHTTILMVRGHDDIFTNMPVAEFVKAFEAAHGRREKEGLKRTIEGTWVTDG